MLLENPKQRPVDIHAADLSNGLEMQFHMLPENSSRCLKVLQHIYEKYLRDMFQNMSAALKIIWVNASCGGTCITKLLPVEVNRKLREIYYE